MGVGVERVAAAVDLRVVRPAVAVGVGRIGAEFDLAAVVATVTVAVNPFQLFVDGSFDLCRVAVHDG